MQDFVHDMARWVAVGQGFESEIEQLYVEAGLCRTSERERVDHTEKLKGFANQKLGRPGPVSRP